MVIAVWQLLSIISWLLIMGYGTGGEKLALHQTMSWRDTCWTGV